MEAEPQRASCPTHCFLSEQHMFAEELSKTLKWELALSVTFWEQEHFYRQV